jgi:hypothetical protein
MNCNSCSKNKKEDKVFICIILNYNRFLEYDYSEECPCKKCAVMIACTKDCDNYEEHCLTPLEEYQKRICLDLTKAKENTKNAKSHD